MKRTAPVSERIISEISSRVMMSGLAPFTQKLALTATSGFLTGTTTYFSTMQKATGKNPHRAMLTPIRCGIANTDEFIELCMKIAGLRNFPIFLMPVLKLLLKRCLTAIWDGGCMLSGCWLREILPTQFRLLLNWSTTNKWMRLA